MQNEELNYFKVNHYKLEINIFKTILIHFKSSLPPPSICSKTKPKVLNLASYKFNTSPVLKRPSASSIASPFGSSLPNRVWSDVSRVYRYGFNGKEKDSETANDNYDFGARIYEGRLGRWLSLDPLMKKFPFESSFIFVSNNPFLYVDITGKEKIIVIGQNEKQGDQGGKLVFAAQSITKLKEYSNSTESKTVIIFNSNNAYTQDQISAINKSVIDNGGTLVTVASEEDFVKYLNTKTTSDFTPISAPRSEDKISSLDVFSHGTVDENGSAWSFGYGSSNSSNLKFDKSDVSKIHSSTFTQTAEINSFACRTGAGVDLMKKKFNPFEIIGLDAESQSKLNKTENGLAQTLSNHLNVKVNAFVCKTDYSTSYGTVWERYLGNEKYDAWSKNNKLVNGALWNPAGAYNKVTAGTSPYGAIKKMMTFTKGNKPVYKE